MKVQKTLLAVRMKGKWVNVVVTTGSKSITVTYRWLQTTTRFGLSLGYCNSSLGSFTLREPIDLLFSSFKNYYFWCFTYYVLQIFRFWVTQVFLKCIWELWCDLRYLKVLVEVGYLLPLVTCILDNFVFWWIKRLKLCLKKRFTYH